MSLIDRDLAIELFEFDRKQARSMFDCTGDEIAEMMQAGGCLYLRKIDFENVKCVGFVFPGAVVYSVSAAGPRGLKLQIDVIVKYDESGKLVADYL